MKTKLFVLFTVAALALIAARPVYACPTDKKSAGLVRAEFPEARLTSAAARPLANPNDDDGIVGLWHTILYFGNGPEIFDESFEQWHSDGTELNLDNAVPPALGNVCMGVWKQVGKTIKLRHVAWNFNANGTLAGTFLLTMTVSVGPGNRTFTGTYVTDSFDLNGTVIPSLHAEGAVRAQRITVD
jgi:hypothetical protein